MRHLHTSASRVIAIFALLAPSLAHAEDLGNGITYDTANGYYSVVANLAAVGTEVRVALPHYSGGAEDLTSDAITVQQHALEEGATVAINANYFGGYPNNYPCGAGRGFGMQYRDGYEEAANCESSLGWTSATPQNVAGSFDSLSHAADGAFMGLYSDVVTGGGYLVLAGQPHDWNHNKLEVGRDCTAAGVSADRQHFIMVATDDTVCDGPTLQQVLLAHGAAIAVQLDGGGSTKMWIRGRGYVNNEPQDRGPPVVIFARPNGLCPSDCGSTECVQLQRPFRAQCLGQPCRSGLAGIWNCDEPKLRRASCQNGVVVSQYCAQGCQPQPNGQDDQCIGGVVPEPGPDAGTDAGIDARAPDGAAHDAPGGDVVLARPDATASAPDGNGDDAPGGGGSTTGGGNSGGCSCRAARADERSWLLVLLAPFALVVQRARRRARSEPRTPPRPA
jgi:hypothetical protein